MSNWKYRLNIKSIWQEENMEIENKGKAIASTIRQTFPASWFDWENDKYDDELEQITQAFENITGYDDTSPVQEFDGWMSALYDFGNREVAPFDQWPPNRMTWIATSF